MGDGGLGMGPNPQSPIPNPQSPIPNPQSPNKAYFLYMNKLENYKLDKNIKLNKF